MTQRAEFTGFQGDTYNVELHAEGTDVAALETFSSVVAKTNQASRFRITTITDARVGAYILVVKDSTTSAVAWTYHLQLTGVPNAEHNGELSRA